MTIADEIIEEELDEDNAERINAIVGAFNAALGPLLEHMSPTFAELGTALLNMLGHHLVRMGMSREDAMAAMGAAFDLWSTQTERKPGL